MQLTRQVGLAFAMALSTAQAATVQNNHTVAEYRGSFEGIVATCK
jgi:hypothetical protein